jgi:hypothetical protein
VKRKVIVEITYDTELASKEGVFNALSELDFIREVNEVKI